MSCISEDASYAACPSTLAPRVVPLIQGNIKKPGENSATPSLRTTRVWLAPGNRTPTGSSTSFTYVLPPLVFLTACPQTELAVNTRSGRPKHGSDLHRTFAGPSFVLWMHNWQFTIYAVDIVPWLGIHDHMLVSLNGTETEAGYSSSTRRYVSTQYNRNQR